MLSNLPNHHPRIYKFAFEALHFSISRIRMSQRLIGTSTHLTYTKLSQLQYLVT
ncbi:hypothetical protein BC829DRAFT_386921 [Chytridium lagenaria]|nr:hypothetical protein BC829DRAFT_386921 [Chytridium lagenaria]